MLKRIGRLLGIETGEGARVTWLIAHSLFNGVFSALFLTAANALFLTRFPITALPLAYIGAAAVGYVAVAGLSWLDQRVSFRALLLANLGTLFALTSAFWILRRVSDAGWIVFGMFVVVGPMFNLIALGYWALAGRLFDLRQGKRLFGLVGAGEEVSTIAALFATPLLVRALGGPSNLVLLAAAGLAGSFVTVVFITQRFASSLESGSAVTRRSGHSGVRLSELLRVRYFLLMSAAVILLNLALYTVDFSFLAQVRQRFPGPGQIAQFFGIFYGSLKIVEFLMKVGVSGPLLSQFGLNVGLLVLPVLLAASDGLAILVGSLGLGQANFFVLVALAKMVAVAGRSSTFEPSFRVLYQPLNASERTGYQSHVEGTARQIAIAVVGIALLLFSRGGSFNALVLFYVLAPLLALWMATAVLVHREYRQRLFDGLTAHAETAAPERAGDVLAALVTSRDAGVADRALRLVERIDPGSLPGALLAALDGPSPEGRLAAVRAIADDQLADLAPQLRQARAAHVAEPQLTATVDAALARLADADALRDRRLVEVLAASDRPADRRLAAAVLGRHTADGVDRLSVLVWDRDAGVRQVALASAGRAGSQDLRSQLIRHLSIPAFAAHAAAALLSSGPAAVNDLERAFLQSGQSLAVRRRILDILAAIGTPEALHAIADQLTAPDRTIRRRALALLVSHRYRAGGDHAVPVERAAETLLRDTAWNLGVLVALESEAFAKPVRDALEEALAEDRRSLFDLLSLVYDRAAITGVRDIVATGSPQGMVHALEILDLLVSPSLKPLLFPMLEGQTHAAVLRKLDALLPRTQMSPAEALRALVRREYGKISAWVRATAVACLGQPGTEIPPDLVACLFHSDQMIREVAAARVSSLDSHAWDTHRGRLRFDIRESLDAVVAARSKEDLHLASIFDRARLLRDAPAFAQIAPDDLLELAAASEARRLEEGQRLPSPRDPRDTMFVAASDAVVVRAPGGATFSMARLGLFTLDPSAGVEAAGPSIVLRLDPLPVFDLAADHAAVTRALVQAEAGALESSAHV